MVVVDRGSGGIDPAVALPCGDGANPMFFGKLVFVDDGARRWRRRWDGADGANCSSLTGAAVNSGGSDGGLLRQWSSLKETVVG